MSNLKEKTDQDPYQRFLEKKHSSFETSVKLIDEMVSKATGSGLVERKKIIDGEVNEVYDALTSNNQSVIVRISRSESPSFEAEEKVIRLARMAGAPAPKVLLIEQTLSGRKKLTFCIEEKIEGESLKRLMGSMDKDLLKPLISEAGGILSKINSVSVEGFGNLDRGTFFKTWAEFIFNMEGKRGEVISAGKTVGVGADLIDRAFSLLRENEEIFDIKEAKLLHGDFSPKHLIVKNSHIAGIIDFEGAKGGDPVRDIAWVNYFYHDTFPIEWLKEGYENKDLFDKNFDLKMKLYRLHLSLDLLQYFHGDKNKSGTIYAKEQLIEELKNF